MKRCALVIGHTSTSPGARNKKNSISEFEFNKHMAREIKSRVSTVEVILFFRKAYSALPGEINKTKPDFIVSLHCNAFNRKVSGTETLYYHKSEKGKKIAQLLNDNLVDALGLKDRGVKPKTSEDRGGYLLAETVAPCVIAEPFFIDNDADLYVALAERDSLAEAYATSIEQIANLEGV